MSAALLVIGYTLAGLALAAVMLLLATASGLVIAFAGALAAALG